MMKIKELADKLHITTRAIRFYEDKGLLDPYKDKENQYRYFTEQDAWRLQTIISLREVGFSVDEIKQILIEADAGDVNRFIYLLELQRFMIYGQWLELKKNIDTMDEMISYVKQKGSLDWQRIFTLADESREWKSWRESWKDRWKFDQQAKSFDKMVLIKEENKASFTLFQDYEHVLDVIVKWISPKKDEVGLDVGTGTGNLAGKFLERGIEIVGVDQSREMLKQANKKYPQLETKLGNFLAIPYPDQSFDFIVTSYAFHHLREEQKKIALAEMQRVLKKNGRICIADFMFESEVEKERYIQALEMDQRVDMLRAIQDKYFSNRSMLIQWFYEKDYVTKEQQINELTHIVYALPIR